MNSINITQPNFQSNKYYTEIPYNTTSRSYYRNEKQTTGEQIAKYTLWQAVAVGLTKLSQLCAEKLMQGKEFTSIDNVKTIADEMLTKNKLKNKIKVNFVDSKNLGEISLRLPFSLKPHIKLVSEGKNAFYVDSLKTALAPKSKPSLILHELGHAINASKGKLLKIMQKSRMFATSLPLFLIFANKALPKDEDRKTFIEKHAFALGCIGFLPTIIEEGLASLRGLKAAKNFKDTTHKPINLKPLMKNYAFAWLTYVIAGIGLGITAKQTFISDKK